MADAAKAPAPRQRQGGFVDLLTLGLFVGGGIVVLRHLVHPNFAKIGSLLGWGPNGSAIVQSAWKWSQKRGLPFAWVLATIIVESRGNPHSTGDSGGESKGLMQVNTVANAKTLAQYGYRPEDMYDIDHGIEIGTLLMLDFYNKIKQHGAARARTPIDETLRLSYKGPQSVYNALDRGQEPSSLSFAHPAIENWRAATQRVAAASGYGPTAPIRLPFV